MPSTMEYRDLVGIDPAEREGRWQELLSATHLGMAVRIPAGRAPEFRASVRRSRIGDLAVLDARCDPCSGLRGLARIRQDAEHHLAVMITRGGRETVGAGSALVDLGPGDAVVWDSSQPARFTVRERLHKQTLIIPPAALRDVPGGTRVVGGTVLCGNAPAVRLLSGFLGLLLGNSDGFTVAAASAARAAALELVVAAARDASTPVSSALGRSLRPLMDTWIDHHLTTGEITPAALAAAHAVSVRTVHRLFAESGETVGGVVRSRRLARARRELLEENHPVADIAMRWGFADASHFTRLFRQEYGCTPSDARRGGER